MAFAKLFEAKPSQILVTKYYPKEEGEGYGVKLTTEAVINGVSVSLEAGITRPDMTEKEMDDLFETMTEEYVKKTCNALYRDVYNEPF